MPTTIFDYLNQRVQSLAHTAPWQDFSPGAYQWREHYELIDLLNAAGHDTSKLTAAIDSTVNNMKQVQEAAQEAKAAFALYGILESSFTRYEKDCLK